MSVSGIHQESPVSSMHVQLTLYFVTTTSTGIYKYTAQWQLQMFHTWQGELVISTNTQTSNKYLFHNFVLYGFTGSILVLREVPDKVYG